MRRLNKKTREFCPRVWLNKRLAAGKEWEEDAPAIGGVDPEEESGTEADEDENAAANEKGHHIRFLDNGWA